MVAVSSPTRNCCNLEKTWPNARWNCPRLRRTKSASCLTSPRRSPGKEAEVSIASNKIQSGYEYRDMPHTVEFNIPETGKKTIIKNETGAVVCVENMTADELQMELDVEGITP